MEQAQNLTAYAQLMALPETMVGECLNGRLYTQPRPTIPHQHINGRLHFSIMGDYGVDDDAPDGWLILIEPEIHFRYREEVVVPDIAGWHRARVPEVPDTAAMHMVPDWVCEILSPSTAVKDRGIKMPLYAERGVAWFWLVDPAKHAVEAFENQAGQWHPCAQAAGTGRATLPPFLRTTLNLQWVWGKRSPT